MHGARITGAAGRRTVRGGRASSVCSQMWSLRMYESTETRCFTVHDPR